MGAARQSVRRALGVLAAVQAPLAPSSLAAGTVLPLLRFGPGFSRTLHISRNQRHCPSELLVPGARETLGCQCSCWPC